MTVVRACFGFVFACVFLLGTGRPLHGQEVEEAPPPPEQGCTYKSDPSAFLKAQAREHEAIHRRVKDFSRASTVAAGASVEPEPPLVDRNFIENYTDAASGSSCSWPNPDLIGFGARAVIDGRRGPTSRSPRRG